MGDLSNPGPIVPLPGLHFGFPVLGSVELRVSVLTVLLANFLQLDILYTKNLTDTLRGYGGVGGDVGNIALTDSSSPTLFEEVLCPCFTA